MPGRPDPDRGAVRLDPRLLIGMVVVAASVLGVWGLVSGLDASTEVYAVRETVTPGTKLSADDLEVRSVRLGAPTDARRYLAVDALPDDGVVVLRTIGAGELVPSAAVGERADSETASVVVVTRGRLPEGVAAGTRVDVWTSAALERGEFDTPSVLVAGAEVAGFVESDGMLAEHGVQVELLVPRDRIAAMLRALAANDAIDLVAARAGEAD
ncbi:hypothetical protein FLP10_02990 [Agromyces intestinalis]|uniref:SAF domain-containing protein n=1 Tax=Agromyces intestinalis TaxID=2592652 RepID=A0A5C1YFF8_9MICO|nr:hypothetical protein [Agromyces intestinalis]QEO13492.1 hypothetical protein FLP10_02990 [Agromyces intestinalis]